MFIILLSILVLALSMVIAMSIHKTDMKIISQNSSEEQVIDFSKSENQPKYTIEPRETTLYVVAENKQIDVSSNSLNLKTNKEPDINEIMAIADDIVREIEKRQKKDKEIHELYESTIELLNYKTPKSTIEFPLEIVDDGTRAT